MKRFLVALVVAAGLLVFPALTMACEVTSINSIPESSNGPSFSPSGNRLAYNGEDANGDYQLWTARSDGTNRNCLTCSGTGEAPPIARHKTGPTWHPSGKFITVQVELPHHPLEKRRRERFAKYLFDNGLWQDMWATTPDGSKWWKLASTTNEREDGIFHTAFSPNGKRMVWGRMWNKADENYPWGAYHMEMAHFKIDNGVPSLRNVRDITPEWGTLIEPGGIRGDKVLFGGNDPTNPATSHLGTADLEVWKLNLKSGAERNLTDDDDWDEHPSYSPDGSMISYLNVSEIDLLDSSGTHLFTHFNDLEVANPMWRTAAIEWPVIPITTDWPSDGTKLAVTIQSIRRYPKTWIAILNLDGCQS